jgi:arginine/lysine/ornithine decarboxylase
MNASDTPLLHVFNNEISGSVIQWCTPSIHIEVPRVQGIYENDISVSYHSLGNPCTNTGVFLKAHELAAKVYGSDHTLFGVNGSTGNNFIVLRALKHQLGKVKLLAQRNVHKSITTASEDYKIDITYIQPRYNNDLQIFVPNTIDEILTAIKKHKPNVLLITNPTYEGLSLYLPDLVSRVRKLKNDIIIFIDEAWGSHFPFSNKLPTTAMESGADICVQSTHKQGSGLQQTSMIHWKDGLISSEHLLDSYTALTTTSPSYHLLASLDGARYFMEKRGEEVLDQAIARADYMRKELNKIPHIHAYSPREIMRAAGRERYQADPTKILIHLDGFSGMELAKNLEDNHKIIVEKYESENVLLIMKMQNYKEEIDQTVTAIKREMIKLSREGTTKFPNFPTTIKMNKFAHKIKLIETIPLDKNAVGRVMAENIVPYPPGIPLITKGEEFLAEHMQYLKALKKTKGLITVIMNDSKISNIEVERI